MNISDEWQSRISIGWCKGLKGTANCTNCHIAYTGDECQITIIEEDPAFMIFFFFHQFSLMLVTVFVLLWTTLGYITIALAGKVDPKNLTNFIIYLNIVFCLSRVATYVDPYGFNHIVSTEFEAITAWVGTTCIITSAVICIAAWLDIIVGMKDLSKKNNFVIAKVVTSVIGGFFFVVCTFVLLFYTFTDNLGFGSNILNILLVVTVITVSVISFYVVPKVNGTVKKARGNKKLGKVVFLLKAVVSICAFSILIGAGFIIVNTVSRTNEPIYHWIFFSIVFIARIAETSACILLNLIIIENPMKTIRVLFTSEKYSSTKTKSKTKSKTSNRTE